jgi:integrase
MLTGQRREEVGAMTWDEIDLDNALWTLPRERTKNGLPHEIPLSPEAVTILGRLPRGNGEEFLFGRGRGFKGWSTTKVRLDERVAKAGAKVRPWRLHDLRRTAATGMATLVSSRM